MWSNVKDFLLCESLRLFPNGVFDSHSPNALENDKTRVFPPKSLLVGSDTDSSGEFISTRAREVRS